MRRYVKRFAILLLTGYHRHMRILLTEAGPWGADRLGKPISWTGRYGDVPQYKNAVHMQVHRAKKAGKLLPEPCEVCGAVKVDAHHDDYSKPLQVRWLCRLHHRAHHAAIVRERMLSS